MWVRASPRRRRNIIHTLSCGGAHKLVWGARTWTETSRAEPCQFGPHPVLRHLSKKVANFLHEYHTDQFASIAPPLLPSDRSDIDIHSILGLSLLQSRGMTSHAESAGPTGTRVTSLTVCDGGTVAD